MITKLKSLIENVLKEYSRRSGFDLPDPFEFDIQLNKDSRLGDFATNAAFKLAKHLRQNPNSIADQIVLLIEEASSGNGKAKLLERIAVAGGGFINFYLAQNFLGTILLEVYEKDRRYGESDFGRGRKVLLEFVSANPTGPLTIAHGRQAAVGDALARMLKATGHEVVTEYYLNDAGRQMNLLGKSLWSHYGAILGKDIPFPDEGYRGAYVRELAEKLQTKDKGALLQEPEEKAVAACGTFARDEIMNDIKEDLKRLKVAFDHYMSETVLYEKGAVDEALNYLTDSGYLYEREGALWFRSSSFGDDKDRVVKKSTGEYTYLAPDIAYHRLKFQRGFQWLINLWGPDHHGYISRLKAACQALGHKPEDIEIRIVQLTTLFRKGTPVRMSTRAGEFVTLRELVNEVGVDAARFFFLMRRIESPLDFDLELAKEKSQENPVYYLQYAHARIASLLRFSGKSVTHKANLELLTSSEERDLIKMISEFPQALVQSAQTLEPYRLADYLRDLATCFHKFYQCHRVVTDDEELTKARLFLVEAARITLRNGLEWLGISQPESM